MHVLIKPTKDSTSSPCRDRFFGLIRLERPPLNEIDETTLQTFNVLTQPGQHNSSKYRKKIPVYDPSKYEAYRCELLLMLFKDFEEVCTGTNICTIASKINLFERILSDNEKMSFGSALPREENFIDEDFDRAVEVIKKSVFPQKCVYLQKKLLSQHCFKPRGMSVCMYVTRFLEINNYLMLFPVINNGPVSKDLLYNGLPLHYQDKLDELGFDVQAPGVTPDALIKFVEQRIEPYDSKADKPSSSPFLSKNDKSSKTKSKQGNANANDGNSTKKQKAMCPIHGNHPMDACNVIKKLQAAHKESKEKEKKGDNQFGSKDLHAMQKALEESNALVKQLRSELKSKSKRSCDDDDKSVKDMHVLDTFRSKLHLDMEDDASEASA